MSLTQDINTACKVYDTKIKPAVAEGDFGRARMETGNIAFLLNEHASEIGNYHSGSTCLLISNAIFRNLKEVDVLKERTYKDLRTYLAQLKLAVESGNRFE